MKTFLVFSLMFAVVACGSKGSDKAPAPTPTSEATTPPPDGDNTADPGADAAPSEVTATDAGPKAPTNQAECVSACEVKYPKAAGQNKMLDNTCFLAGACEPVCNDLVAGKNYQPTVDPDAGPTCDTVKADSYPVSTPSQACSDCIATTPACCNLWIAIFGSDEGKNLNACTNKCYTTFKN